MVATSNAKTAPVLDLSASRRSSTRLIVDHGAAYELLVVATALEHESEHHTYALGEQWYDDVRTAFTPEVRSMWDQLAHGRCSLWTPLAALVHATPDRTDVDAVLDHLARLDPAVIWTALIDGALHGLPARRHGDLLATAATAGAAERERLFGALCADTEICAEDRPEALEGLIRGEPRDLRDAVVGVLRGLREIIRDHLAEVGPALERDAAQVRQRIAGLPPTEAIEAGTNGIRYTPAAGIRTVLLLPQVAMRPWVLIDELGDHKLFFPAAAEESLEAGRDVPPPRLVALCKALAEEQRLRLLRRLAQSPATLQQLADHLGVAKSTVHHHTVVLRAAGLITVEVGTERGELSLRPDLVSEATALLETYLWRGRR